MLDSAVGLVLKEVFHNCDNITTQTQALSNGVWMSILTFYVVGVVIPVSTKKKNFYILRMVY